MQIDYRIALLGNPNCGKTTLFNALTGARHHVGNWPGVTVEKKTGHYVHGDRTVEVVDLPGTYSLAAHQASPDERIALDFIASGEADLIIDVVDAANLERNLYLTTQLAATGAPMLVALNMTDVATDKGQPVDAAALAARLGCPVVPLIAAKGEGIDGLKAAVHEAVAQKPHVTLAGPPEGGNDIDIATARYALAAQIAAAARQGDGAALHLLTERIDRVVLHRWLGVPIFLLTMYLMFMFSIKFGGAFVDFFDQAAGALFVEGFGNLLDTIGAPEWLSVLLAKGIGGGLQTVATFIPIIGSLYLFLAVLEDSGYMARATFVMDRLMHVVGLPGKSFVPLIVGFGCNVPAIMATRTLERHHDRLQTIAMAPFMSCGARLPVYVLFAAAFFPGNAQNMVFALYLIGILAAVGTGLLLKHSLLRSKPTPYAMELPPYLLPTLRGVTIHGWERLKSFIISAGRIIVPMVVVINFLNAVGPDGSFSNQDSDKSILAAIGRAISPVFAPFGLREENWPATVGIFTGILAKEVIVGTLNATYSALTENTAGAKEEDGFDLGGTLAVAVATIPTNLANALGKWYDPLGIAVGELTDLDTEAERQGVEKVIFREMMTRFDGPAGAFAYLLFVLLYTPCTAALGAIYRESGARWMLFVATWTFGLAYGAATLYYQVATFAAHPLSSAVWIGAVGAVLATALVALRRYGQRREYQAIPLMPQAVASGCDGCNKAGLCGYK